MKSETTIKSIEEEIYKVIGACVSSWNVAFRRGDIACKGAPFINDSFETENFSVTFFALPCKFEEDFSIKYYDLVFFAFAKNKVKVADAIAELNLTPIKLDYYRREYSRIYFLLGIGGKTFKKKNELYVPISSKVKNPGALILAYLLNYYLVRAARLVDSSLKNSAITKSLNLWKRIKIALRKGARYFSTLCSIIRTLHYRTKILEERGFDKCITSTAKLFVEFSLKLFNILKKLIEKIFLQNLKDKLIKHLKEVIGLRRLGTFIKELYKTVEDIEIEVSRREVKEFFAKIAPP